MGADSTILRLAVAARVARAARVAQAAATRAARAVDTGQAAWAELFYYIFVYIYSIWALNRGQYPYKWLWDYAGDKFLKPEVK